MTELRSYRIAAQAPVLVRETGGSYTGGSESSSDWRVADPVLALSASLLQTFADRDLLEELDADQCRDRIQTLVRLGNAVGGATAEAVARLAAMGGIKKDGSSSTRNWLTANTNCTQTEAGRLAALAGGLDDLPGTAEALRAGEVSPTQAEMIRREAEKGRLGDPAAVEDELLGPAKNSRPEDLKRRIDTRTQTKDGSKLLRDEQRQHQLRRASLVQDDDGMWDLNAKLTNAVGIKARTLFNAIMTFDPDPEDPDQARTYVQRQADALEASVDQVLDHRDLPTDNGQARPHVTVVVDVQTVIADLTNDDGTGPVPSGDPIWADLAGGTSDWSERPLSPQWVRALCCDANLTRVLTNGPSQVLDVGRATRKWTAAQRTAIRVRDHGCRGPGCRRPIAWTDIHHLIWWRHDGPTDLNNGIALCRSCHNLIHHDNWTVQLDLQTAAATWTSPDGRIIVTTPRGIDDHHHRRQPA